MGLQGHLSFRERLFQEMGDLGLPLTLRSTIAPQQPLSPAKQRKESPLLAGSSEAREAQGESRSSVPRYPKARVWALAVEVTTQACQPLTTCPKTALTPDLGEREAVLLERTKKMKTRNRRSG